MKKLALFRADAGPDIGIGHVMRCAIIANELAQNGYECRFATVSKSLTNIPDDDKMLEPIEIDPAADPASQLEAMRAEVSFADLLVVDHYGLEADFETAARDWCGKLMVIDDFTHRSHDCDLYLNFSIDLSLSDITGLLPSNCKKLLGPLFAPLRKEYSEARSRCLPRPKRPARQLLITLGGGNFRNVVLMVLEGLSKSSITFEIDLILTGVKAATDVCTRARDLGAVLHNHVPNLAALIEKADICIGAGGMTTWDRACLGLPTLMIELSDNQKRNISGLQNAGAAIEVDASSSDAIAVALASLANDEDKLASMSAAGAALCDGQGAGRIVDAIVEHTSVSTNELPASK